MTKSKTDKTAFALTLIFLLATVLSPVYTELFNNNFYGYVMVAALSVIVVFVVYSYYNIRK